MLLRVGHGEIVTGVVGCTLGIEVLAFTKYVSLSLPTLSLAFFSQYRILCETPKCSEVDVCCLLKSRLINLG